MSRYSINNIYSSYEFLNKNVVVEGHSRYTIEKKYSQGGEEYVERES